MKIRVSEEEKKLISLLHGTSRGRLSDNIRAALLAPQAKQLPRHAADQARALNRIDHLLVKVVRATPADSPLERLLVLQQALKIARELKRIMP